MIIQKTKPYRPFFKLELSQWVGFTFLILPFFFTLHTDTFPNKKEDSYGRVYRVKKDGGISFPIDTSYYTVVPSVEEFVVHIAEAKGLEEIQEKKKSIQLRKNLSFCVTIIDSDEKNKISDLILENSNSLNRFLSMEKSRIEKILKLDSCYYKNRLYIRNEEFGITLQFPTESIPKNLQDLSISSGSDREVEWTFIRWKKKSSRTKPEIDLDNALEVWNSEELKLPDDGYSITFALSKHKYDELSESFLLNYWEKKRGLTPNTKSIYSFSRKKNPSDYLVSYTIVNRDNKKDFSQIEKYLHRNRKGMSIFFQSPTESLSEITSIWKEILDSGRFQGKVLSSPE